MGGMFGGEEDEGLGGMFGGMGGMGGMPGGGYGRQAPMEPQKVEVSAGCQPRLAACAGLRWCGSAKARAACAAVRAPQGSV